MRTPVVVVLLSLLLFMVVGSQVVGASNATTFRGLGNATALPNTQRVSSADGRTSVTLRYGYDKLADALAIQVEVDYGPEQSTAAGNTSTTLFGHPGWVGLGLRDRAMESYATMGPAKFVQSYHIPASRSTNSVPANCEAHYHLTTVENFFPTPGKGDDRIFKWKLHDFSAFTGVVSGRSIQSFQGVITGLKDQLQPGMRDTWWEAMVAVGDARQVSATRCSGTDWLVATSKHNLLARRLNITLPGHFSYFTLPPYPNGCSYGEPSEALSNSTGAKCTRCFDGFQGPNCSTSCVCDHGFCSTAVTINTGHCTACDSGHYGPTCQPCRCNTAQGGSCQDGVVGNGFCVCTKPPFGGPTCDDCDAYHYGPNCSRKCLCNMGICDNRQNASNGWCRSCYEHYAGVYCNLTCPDCAAVGQVCDSGVNGTATCMVVTTTPQPPTPAPTIPVEGLTVTMAGSVNDFRTDSFKSVVAQALVIHVSELEIEGIYAGSVVVEFKLTGMSQELQQQKYQTFVELVDRNDPSVSSLGILAVEQRRVGVGTPRPQSAQPPTAQPPAVGNGSNASGSESGISPSGPTNNPGVVGTVSPGIVPVQPSTGLSTSEILGIVIGLTILVATIAAIIGCAIRTANTSDDSAEELDDDDLKKHGADESRGKSRRDRRDDAFGVDGSLQGSGSASRGGTPPPEAGEAVTAEEIERMKAARRRELLGEDSDDEEAGLGAPTPGSDPTSPNSSKYKPLPSGHGQAGPHNAGQRVAAQGSAPGASAVESGEAKEKKAAFALKRKEAPPTEVASAATVANTKGAIGGGMGTVPAAGLRSPAAVSLPPAVGGGATLQPLSSRSDSIEEIGVARPMDPPPAPPAATSGGYGTMDSTQSHVTAPGTPDRPESAVNRAKGVDIKRSDSGKKTPAKEEVVGSSSPPPRTASGNKVNNSPEAPVPSRSGGPSTASPGPVAAHPNRPETPSVEPQHRRTDSPDAMTDGLTATESTNKREKDKKKKCKYCNKLFVDAPDTCEVEGRSHRVLKEERRIEKKAKKDARRRVAAQIAAEHAHFVVDDSEAD